MRHNVITAGAGICIYTSMWDIVTPLKFWRPEVGVLYVLLRYAIIPVMFRLVRHRKTCNYRGIQIKC
ncbi:hypothetical protein K439DRAFT_749107 [Ramaria rubella]|nr:hypothetical protein K439DRAFT_749107 [Ramaria rubella]